MLLKQRIVSCRDILNIAKKNGFLVCEGSKHSKIKDNMDKTITIVPRHNKLDRGTAKGILKRLKDFGANIEIL